MLQWRSRICELCCRHGRGILGAGSSCRCRRTRHSLRSRRRWCRFRLFLRPTCSRWFGQSCSRQRNAYSQFCCWVRCGRFGVDSYNDCSATFDYSRYRWLVVRQACRDYSSLIKLACSQNLKSARYESPSSISAARFARTYASMCVWTRSPVTTLLRSQTRTSAHACAYKAQ